MARIACSLVRSTAPAAAAAALLVALGLAFAGCQTSQTPSAAATPSPLDAPSHAPKLLEGLGPVHHPISTRNPEAQRYFDQGLALTYGFNHEGAIDAFRQAARLDPTCAICWWGVAYAHGPNINAPMGPAAAAQAYAAAQRAEKLSGSASEKERAYIEALQERYGEPAGDGSPETPKERAARDLAFANAMRAVAAAHPDDLDAAVLFAESLMDLSPWSYWGDDGAPRSHTPEVEAQLARVLERSPEHIGALHYWIHLYERFEPEKAVDAADRLGALAPSAGHLVHMPAHVYYRVGRYADSAAVNVAAEKADSLYFAYCRSLADYAAAYTTHNVHFLWASEMAQGRGDAALVAARRLVSLVPQERIGELPFLEDFVSLPILTLVRFGRWDAVLGEPAPPASQRFATAMWHYARGVAFARQRRIAQAQAEYEALVATSKDGTLGALIYDTSGGTAGQRLAVARNHLAGEMAAAAHAYQSAFAAFEEAVRVQDSMPYSEPPPFYLPVRLAYGAVLLDAGQPKKAEALYREDLRRHPNSGWALYGLARSLEKQRKRPEAKAADAEFRRAFARADVKLASSRL